MDREHRMLDARILQGQGFTQREIAAMIGVTDRTVRNYLKQLPGPRKRPNRASKLDPYKPLVEEILEEAPSYNGELIYERLQALGYAGRISILKDYVAAVRRRIAYQAVLRFETEPGYQAQVDWKEFGRQTVDGRPQKLYAFVMVLGYSRRAFVRFTTAMDGATLLACHLLAFRHFGGVPREILYDNMKSAFQLDSDGRWRASKRLAAVAAHYGFTPRRCRVRRPETKGKVERAIGYLDGNFWPRLAGQALSLAELGEQVLRWLAAIDTKPISGFAESRAQRFEREKAALRPLPALEADIREEVPVAVSREATIRHATNTYSVPPQHIGQMLTLKVHPFTPEAELFGPDGSIRRFRLEPAGARQRVQVAEDREAMRRRWETDRARTLRIRTPRRVRPPRAALEVEVRSPASYERFLPTEGQNQEVSA